MTEINSEYKSVICEEIKEVKNVVMKTFIQLFKNFLNQEQINVNLTPEVKKYFVFLCNESPDLFLYFEKTLKKIISDDRINTKDIPDILELISNVYKIINKNNGIPTIDKYELTKMLLHLTFVVYIETNKVNNSQLLLDILQIIDSSIELIKLTPIKDINIGFFNCLKC